MIGVATFKNAFEAVADDYEAARPGYPDEMFCDIKEQCRIDEHARILEIGAGSGTATVELAKFGCAVVAVEPGEKLGCIVQKKLAGKANVQFFVGTFDDAPKDGSFSAVMAFTAFHWLGGQDKYAQVASCLAQNGKLVLAWNSFLQSDDEVTAAVNKVYTEVLPELYPQAVGVTEVNSGVLKKLKSREQEVYASELFMPVFLQRYYTEYRYDEQTYPLLLKTFPQIQEQATAKCELFLKEISETVRRFGGITVPVLSSVIIAMKTGGATC